MTPVRLLPLVLVAAAPAAERTVPVPSFDRVRVQGPVEVAIGAAHTPVVALSGDRAAVGAVEVRVDGATLTIRRPPGALAAAPVRVTLGNDRLVGASVIGGGTLTIARMAGGRVDLTLTGAGRIAVAELSAEAANATLIGGGAMTLAGRAGAARLMTNGDGTLDAGALDAGDLFVRLDGPGATAARARYAARVIDTGSGRVTVAGRPKCSVSAPAGGAVACNDYGPR